MPFRLPAIPILALALTVSSHVLADPAPFLPPSNEAKVEAVLAQLTLEEKVALLHGSALFYSAGVPRLGIEEMAYTDGPLGVREEVSRDSWAAAGWTNDEATYFPSGTALAATWNPERVRECGAAMGREARARGKDILLAPAINVIRSPLCGRNYEYFSEEPALIAPLATAFIQGVQSTGVASCVKHFAVNNQETNRGTIDAQVSQRALREVYLRAFEAAVRDGQVAAVMGAYNHVNGLYACENPQLLNDILKEEWGFRGIVVSDWAATHSTVASARAGLDVEMGTVADFDAYFFAQPLIDAVKAGELEESVVDEMARRVLRVMAALGKLDSTTTRPQGEINTPRHSQIIREAASEAIVLLQNQGGQLPLDPAKLKTVAVIGDNAICPHAQGGFGASVKAAYEVTPLEGLRAALGPDVEIRHARGYQPQYLRGGPNDTRNVWELPVDQTPDPELFAEALEAAKGADLVIFIGGDDRNVESEAADRRTIALPFGQDALVSALAEVNPNLVTVVIAGAAVDLRTVRDRSAAVVWGWFNGAESGNALADVLCGKVNPSGKLPFTLPATLDQLGAHAVDAFPGNDEIVRYEEELFVGYRWLDAHALTPTFPFGFGLSYTTFTLSAPRLEGNHVRVTLRNTGERAGAETVQVYASFPGSTLDRPVRQLVGFRKVFLEAGTSAEVDIPLPDRNLASYDKESGQLVVQPGEYTLAIGTSSRSLPLQLVYQRH